MAVELFALTLIIFHSITDIADCVVSVDSTAARALPLTRECNVTLTEPGCNSTRSHTLTYDLETP